jgi:hypothetical protein
MNHLPSFQIFLKIQEDIFNSRGTTGIIDTGSKFATGINDSGGKFATGINYTGGKFVNNIRLLSPYSELEKKEKNYLHVNFTTQRCRKKYLKVI